MQRSLVVPWLVLGAFGGALVLGSCTQSNPGAADGATPFGGDGSMMSGGDGSTSGDGSTGGGDGSMMSGGDGSTSGGDGSMMSGGDGSTNQDGSGGTFACGMMMCNPASQYCYEVTLGPRPPWPLDMGPPTGGAGSCVAYPAQCLPTVTCACLLAAMHRLGCTCSEHGGDFTVLCGLPLP